MNFAYLSRLSVLVLLLGTAAFAAEKTDPDAFRSDVARLEVRKPSGWHFQSLDALLANRASVKVKDEEFQKAIEQMAHAPLVVATKHPEPYENLNPTLQVLVRPTGPLAGKTGVEILRLVEPTLETQFADFTTVRGIHSTTVAGHPAGRFTVRYTLQTQDGRELPTQATIVMVPRGKVLYQFGFSAPSKGPDALKDEVDAVLASVKFVE